MIININDFLFHVPPNHSCLHQWIFQRDSSRLFHPPLPPVLPAKDFSISFPIQSPDYRVHPCQSDRRDMPISHETDSLFSQGLPVAYLKPGNSVREQVSNRSRVLKLRKDFAQALIIGINSHHPDFSFSYFTSSG